MKIMNIHEGYYKRWMFIQRLKLWRRHEKPSFYEWTKTYSKILFFFIITTIKNKKILFTIFFPSTWTTWPFKSDNEEWHLQDVLENMPTYFWFKSSPFFFSVLKKKKVCTTISLSKRLLIDNLFYYFL